MIVILVLLLVAAIITFLIWLEDNRFLVSPIITNVIILTGLFSMIWGISYTSYIRMRSSYDTVVTQYKDSVTIYADRAVLDIKSAALTDFQYQGYQENIAKFISDLRREVVVYNKTFIEKKTIKKNPLFSWLIVAPDADMRLISLKD